MSLRLTLRFCLTILLTLALGLSSFTSTAQAGQSRSNTDRADDVKGAQLHIIYVVAADAQDKNWDTNGQIKTWLDSAQSWFTAEIGKTLRIDTFNNDYDISFLQSKIKLSDMKERSSGQYGGNTPLLPDLMNEFLSQSPQLNYQESPKTYLFVTSEQLDTKSCGYANTFSVTGITFVGPGCWNGPQDDTTYPYGMSYPAAAIIHEAIHTYGVSHTCDNSSNLMLGSPECTNQRSYSRMTMDPARTSYYGGEKSGTDISKLLIWSDGSGEANYGKVTAVKSYTWKTDGENSLTIGGNDQTVSWDWSKIGQASTGSYFNCTLTAAEGTITAKMKGNQCLFEIPLTWRGGQLGQLTGKIIVGPYFGDTTMSIKILNPENSYQACSAKYCFVGQSVQLTSIYCYTSDKMNFELQRYINNQWQVTNDVPAVAAESCGPDKYRPKSVSINYQDTGSFIYRWVQKSISGMSGYEEPISAISVLPANAEYPNTAKLSALNQLLENDKSAAQAAAAVFAAARTLLNNQLAQCNDGQACYTGQIYKSNDLCFSGSIEKFQLEQLIDKKWIVVFTGTGTKDDPACSPGTTRTPRHEMSFSTPGLQITRWVTTTAGKASVGNPYGVIIKDLKDGLITQTEINNAQTQARSIVKSIEEANKPVIAKKSITCVKGKLTKKITSVNPTCPKGYKKK